MTDTITQPSTAVVVLESLVPATVFAPGGVDPIPHVSIAY